MLAAFTSCFGESEESVGCTDTSKAGTVAVRRTQSQTSASSPEKQKWNTKIEDNNLTSAPEKSQ